MATVSSDGLVTGVAAGTATITATGEGLSGTATITVTSSGRDYDLVFDAAQHVTLWEDDLESYANLPAVEAAYDVVQHHNFTLDPTGEAAPR